MRTVVILMDTLRRDYLSCYNPDTDCKAEHIREFSRDCCTFDRHFTGSMPCMPARRDILTGRTNFLERSWGPIEIFDTTFPKVLQEYGVRSHIITDHAHYFRIGGENYCQQFSTYEFFRGQESDPWVSLIDDPYMPEQYFGDVKRQYQCNRTRFNREEDYPSVKCFNAAMDWVDKNRGADDFLLMVETFDPHEPFDIPYRYLELYGDDYIGPQFDLPRYHKIDQETDEAMAHLRRRYKALITMTDIHFGRFIDKLKEAGMYDDTLIILTTDHGYCLGEREYIGKNYMPCYNELCNIPLLIHLPKGENAGVHRQQLTQNTDLMPTILRHYGITIPDSVKGVPLQETITRNNATRPYVLYGAFGLSVNYCDGIYTYMRGPRDNIGLYEYTTSLTTLRGWLGKEIPDQIECGHYLERVPYPVYRIPAVKNPLTGSLGYLQEDHLFHIEEDYGQQNDIVDMMLREEMEHNLSLALEEYQAPAEQWERMGLKRT